MFPKLRFQNSGVRMSAVENYMTGRMSVMRTCFYRVVHWVSRVVLLLIGHIFPQRFQLPNKLRGEHHL